MANTTDWLSISALSGGSGTTILTLTADTNSETMAKMAKITVMNLTYDLSKQINVTQAADTTLSFVTDTSNVAGSGETRTITILNQGLNENDTGLNLPSDFHSPGSYVVSGNTIYLTYPVNPSSSATRTWTIGVVGMTTGGTSLYGSYTISQNANLTYPISYTADTSTVSECGETRTITIDTTGLISSSITVNTSGATGITTSYNNGVVTVVFPANSGTLKHISVTINGTTTNGYPAKAELTYAQNGNVSPSDYLTFIVLSSGDIKWVNAGYATAKTIEYNKNNFGWVRITSASGTSAPSISVATGDIVYFRGNNSSYGASINTKSNGFKTTCSFVVQGNVMSLINSTGFTGETTFQDSHVFTDLFGGCTGLTSASGLVLPATTLTDSCYARMFNGCSAMTTIPDLPATTLAPNCYHRMFGGCNSISSVPNDYLPVTALTNGCYYRMFAGCTNLTGTPSLPAITLADRCYQEMFVGCTSLTTPPALPATTLAQFCYDGMFSACTSLTSVPSNYLPVTVMAYYCYSHMFEGCTSLTTAPDLPATTLAERCYDSMFINCLSLTYIKCLATDISAPNCTLGWVLNTASSGTFVTPSSTQWTTGQSGIPSGWTRVNAT